MVYELNNGILQKFLESEEIIVDKNILKSKYTRQLGNNTLIIDSEQNKCYIVSKDIQDGNIPENLYRALTTGRKYENNESEDITFILAITYMCNLHCSYCYQQHDKTLDKKLISKENLKKIFDIIEKYKSDNPEKNYEIGLFGGEPLLKSNEWVIDEVFDFCKKNRIRVHITTNGSNLDYYLKKIIINRKIISSINPTIDTFKLNYVTRHSIDESKNNEEETEKLLKCIKTLLFYNVPVNVATNIDAHNCDKIWEIYDDFQKQGLLDNGKFTWSLGRVDDRLYETNYKDIIDESKIIARLLEHEIPKNMHAAFMKTTYGLTKLMGLELNQNEARGRYNYCWNSSISDKVFYVDSNLKSYRCTYTVGRPKYSILDFTKENIDNYSIVEKTNLSYEECKGCDIGGYCGGGCQLSHDKDFSRCCEYEKYTFNNYIENILIPYLKKICELNGVIL